MTNLNIKISANNLGENPTTVTFTAPSGAYFYDGSSSYTTSYVNSTSHEYTLTYETVKYGTLFKAGEIAVAYDSTNAAVSSAISLASIEESCDNNLSTAVPYLMYEDFSGLAESGDTGLATSSTTNSSISGLSGWVAGARSAWYAGYCINIQQYSNIGGPYKARFNSKTFSSMGLKDGKTVTLKVTFNSDWSKNNANYLTMKVGRSSGTSLDDSISSTTELYDAGSEYTWEEREWYSKWPFYQYVTYSENSLKSTSKDEEDTFTERTVTISSCTPSERIAWKTNGENASFFSGSFSYEDLYIDNVRVQIAN